MDRTDSSAARGAEFEPAHSAYHPDVAAMAPESAQGQNRLVHYIRSMPLVSLLFGRSVAQGNFTNEANRCFIFKCLMAFHLLILATLLALTSFAIYYYNIRFYKSQTRPSETLIVCWLLRAMWHTINSAWSLRYYCSGAAARSNLKLSTTFYNIASILWVSLAVVFLGVSPREDLKSASSRICYFLLWITIASYVVPMLAYTVICLMLYLTVFVVIYFRHGTIGSPAAMPVQLLKKLRVLRYREVLKMVEGAERGGRGPAEPAKPGSPAARDVVISMPSPLPVPAGEGLSECVNNAEMMSERLCSICILVINDDDKVFVLPCDLRHLFHIQCLKKWFKRSCECPICRCNVAKLLQGDEKLPPEEGAPGEETMDEPGPVLAALAQHGQRGGTSPLVCTLLGGTPGSWHGAQPEWRPEGDAAAGEGGVEGCAEDRSEGDEVDPAEPHTHGPSGCSASPAAVPPELPAPGEARRPETHAVSENV